MKKRGLILLLAIIGVLFGACEKETILSVSQTTINIPDAGGSQSITLTANKPWTASSNQSWCKVSPSSGEEATNSRITITCDANTTYDERSCTVTFTCAEMTSSVNVTQATNNGLLVSQKEYNISNEAQQLNIEVKANVKFSVEVDEACKKWVKYNTTKGLTTSTVVLDISKNESYDGREGKVTIKQTDGNITETVIIKQGQLDGLFLTTSEYNLSDEQHTLTVEVKSNIEFEVKSEAEWIKYVETKGLKSDQIILDVAANNTYDEREGKVTVKQKNGNLTGTIVIRQDENFGILVSQSAYELSNEAQTIDVEVKYNVDFDVVIPSGCKDWIKQVSTKSLNSRTYTFSIAKNKTYDNREGSITFKQKKGDISTTVSIKQAQTDYLEVAKKEYLVDVEGETIKIEVTSNVDYTVTIDESAKDWLKIVETKGLSKNIISIAVSPGNDDTDRIGNITISHGDTTHTIIVHQYPYAAHTIIEFADEKVKERLVTAFDANNDGELSIKEARAVKSIEGVFGAIKTYKSFDEFQYFSGVTRIPNNMFQGWNQLTSITLPDSIESIGHYAFKDCVKLNSIDIPVGNIGKEAFMGCVNMTSVTMREGVNSIGSGAFSGCSKLTSVEIPNSVTLIDSYTFMSCTSLESVVLPESITCIGNYAFKSCKSLSSVIIPDNVATIEDGAFYGCVSLKDVTIPGSVWKLGNSAFENGEGLSSVIIPASVTVIGRAAFKGCRKLISVEIPERVTAIQVETFSDCSSLTSIVIPKSITTIYNDAFKGCTNINRVDIADVSAWCRINFANTINPLSFGAHLFLNGVELTTLEIPDNVTYIGYGAFINCPSISSVVIPESVTSIGPRAFNGCINLKSVTIPESVSSIEDYTFCGCTGLTSIEIPNSVTSIGSYTFYGCTGLTTIEIPDTVTSIEDGTFGGCTSLASIVIPDSVTNIGPWAFMNCTNLRRVDITDIGAWCRIHFKTRVSNPLLYAHHLYLNGVEVTSLEIPNNVTSILYSAFIGCTLTSVVIPDSVTSIEEDAFYGCTLTSVVIPDSVTSIGNSAFSNCFNLSSIVIPDSVTSIGDNAFSHCTNLSSIVMRDRGTSIGDNAFYDLPESIKLTAGVDVCRFFLDLSNKSGDKWFTVNYTMIEGPTVIDKEAFKGYWNLESIVIPNTVTSIGDRAFYNCFLLSSIVIPNSITEIGYDAFGYDYSYSYLIHRNDPRVDITDIAAWCNIDFTGSFSNPIALAQHLFLNGVEVSSLEIPNSVKSIKQHAFYCCTSLTSVILPNSVTSIGKGAFSNCTNLSSISIPNSVTSISGFSGCTGLTSIVIPDSVTNIESGAFSDCTGLTSIEIPNSVTSIGDRVFYNCTKLSSVIIPNGVTTIGDDAFYHCTSLSSIVIPDSVTSIGCRAFANAGLLSIDIPAGITKIGNEAFYSYSSPLKKVNISDLKSWCSINFGEYSNPLSYAHHLFINGVEITELEIPDGVTSISPYAFYGCTNLTSITIPKSVTKIGSQAFYNCTGMKKITVLREEPPKLMDKVFYYSSGREYPLYPTIYVPRNSISAYKSDSGWSKYVLYDSSNIKAIQD